MTLKHWVGFVVIMGPAVYFAARIWWWGHRSNRGINYTKHKGVTK